MIPLPDWIIGVGLIDDAIVLDYIIKQINSDLEKYEIWKRESDSGAVAELR